MAAGSACTKLTIIIFRFSDAGSLHAGAHQCLKTRCQEQQRRTCTTVQGLLPILLSARGMLCG